MRPTQQSYLTSLPRELREQQLLGAKYKEMVELCQLDSYKSICEDQKFWRKKLSIYDLDNIMIVSRFPPLEQLRLLEQMLPLEVIDLLSNSSSLFVYTGNDKIVQTPQDVKDLFGKLNDGEIFDILMGFDLISEEQELTLDIREQSINEITRWLFEDIPGVYSITLTLHYSGWGFNLASTYEQTYHITGDLLHPIDIINANVRWARDLCSNEGHRVNPYWAISVPHWQHNRPWIPSNIEVGQTLTYPATFGC